MTSSNGNIFSVTGHLCVEFTGPRWFPHTKASEAELWCFSLICAWIICWVNNREAGDLRRHRDHYDVTVMLRPSSFFTLTIYFKRSCVSVLSPSFTWRTGITFQWRHNERDGVSNHRRLNCFLNRLFSRRSKLISNLYGTCFVRKIHRWSVERTGDRWIPLTKGQ